MWNAVLVERTGISLVIGNIQRKEKCCGTGKDDAPNYDKLWKVCVIVVIRMLIIYKQIDCDHQQDAKSDYRRYN